MRVISGSARGLKLLSLNSLATRPTLDRVKEAMFSILTPYLASASVLDLFAGSGALGIEALSRGADKAVFVDNSNAAMDIIKKNASSARVSAKASFALSSAEDYLKKSSLKFDIVFLDPPYAAALYKPSLDLIASKALLNEGGVIVLEWDSALPRPDIPLDFSLLKERKYGRVMLTFLECTAQKMI